MKPPVWPREWVRRLPVLPPSWVMARLLDRALWPRLDEGQRAHLRGACIEVEATDLGLRVRLQAGAHGFGPGRGPARATVRADAAALWALARGEVDADRLFFERRLVLEGDTALALALKSTLEAVGPLWAT